MFLRMALLFTLAITGFGSLANPAFAMDDIQEHRSCSICGMDRKAYGYSRVLIMYQNGGQTGVCSLHCAVTDLDSNKDRPVKSVLVADRDSRSLIDAESAFWVLGGSKRGVMTQRPKWAFAVQAEAREFIDAYGGVLTSWQDIVVAAQMDAKIMAREILTENSKQRR